MRFTKLVVESFQAIERAELEFGPGLNVVYGPNDLGKSTLATALRAALLVPPKSSEALSFTPWYADAVPRVSLTFSDEQGGFWRVSKGFGSGSTTGAELASSKDGRSFALHSKARQVEEKLRELLGWGIPAPGGKSGPRGLPQSFLANVLLAAQTDVDAILGQSLAEDADGSGKLRLTKALATLAQDPLFKRALTRAQKEVDACFTATGRRKSGQSSCFTEASNRVKELEHEHELLRRQREDSLSTERHVSSLRERRNEALLAVGEARAARARLAQREREAEVRARAAAELGALRAELASIDALAARIAALGAELEAHAAGAAERERELALGARGVERAEAELARAEQALRLASSEDGARQRELERAALAEQRALAQRELQACEVRHAALLAARDTLRAAEQAEAALVAARAERARLAALDSSAGERVREAEAELALVRAIMAYGRFRGASAAADDATRAKAAGAEAARDAAGKLSQADSLAAQASALEGIVAARAASLGALERARAFVELERELQLAEAALGGGLSIALRAKKKVALRAKVDGSERELEPSTSLTLEAERRVLLSVGDAFELEVTAGAAEQRRRVDALRARWQDEVVPELSRAGVSSPAALLTALEGVERQRRELGVTRQQVERLRGEARALEQLAAAHAERAAKADAGAAELELRRQAFSAADSALLEQHWQALGAAWEAQTEALGVEKSRALERARAARSASEQALGLADYRCTEAERRAAELGEKARAATSTHGADLAAQLATLEQRRAALARSAGELEATLGAHSAAADGAVQRAEQAVASARAGLGGARQAQVAAASALDESRARLHDAQGEQRTLRAELERRERAALAVRVSEAERALAALPDPGAVTAEQRDASERELARAERELEEAKEELFKSEGALSKVGGAAVHDELVRVEHDLARARVREREVEVDADAWKLLLETLRGVENEQGAHLGKSLAQPITSKFSELTAGRYTGLSLDAALRTEGLGVASASAATPDVISALSVGTRDQLATLLRLTIADQLKAAIVLDDHLVHTDPRRLAWFRGVLLKTALNAQVVVLTCRPEDYLSPDELPSGVAMRDLAGGSIRSIDASRAVKRWSLIPARPSSVPALASSQEA
jgi:hypothetical protein